MFFTERKNLQAALNLIQKKLCAYTGGARCDCKFGATDKNVGTGHESGNGCPEMMQAIILIENLTEFEYNRLCKRAGIITSEKFDENIKRFNKKLSSINNRKSKSI